MRRVLYVTGSRADFGLMRHTLERIHGDDRLDLELCVTGMHMIAEYGNTMEEIRSANLPIAGTVPVRLDGSDGESMAHAIADELHGMANLFARRHPDIVLLLGDRGEMLAGALAAIHLNIPVAHIHGGELSGTVDEPVRHAISKLSHFHFVSTHGAKERLVRMGEHPEHVFMTGAPGIDRITEGVVSDRTGLCAAYGFDPSRPVALYVFHPVVQEAAQAGNQAEALLDCLMAHGFQIVAVMPNGDAGGKAVRKAIENRQAEPGIRMVTHLERSYFLKHLASVDLLAGNSSSGIIEAASFGLPVLNVGTRQAGRERSKNTLDTAACPQELDAAISSLMARGREPCCNIYGDGHAARTIVDLLATLPIDHALLLKCNAY